MKIPLRNTGADDNLCEKIMNDDCDECNGCNEGNEYFEINKYDGYFTISYYHKIGDIIIVRNSERIEVALDHDKL